MARERDEVTGEFVQFQDNPESPFYCADGISAVETWDRSVEAMADVLIELPQVTTGDFRLTPELLSEWHRQIFGELFPEDAGRLRWRKEGEWEEVFFGGDVGTARSRRTKEYKGTHPKKLPDRVSEICDEFNEARKALIEAEPGSISLNDATYVAARLYCKILRVHPWVDGNLRVAFVALHTSLLSLDLPRVMFRDLQEHDDLIGIAFRGDNEPYRPLATYIAEYIRDELQD
ncbi:MAG TPA: Fic family protein [Solirubrobacterales bacterium]|jgi:fido (protein-threonine AMPylation protein)